MMMGLMLLGLVLWVDAHLFRRLLPGPRARLGDKARGLVAVVLLLSVVLMVAGYRQATGPVWWGAGPATKGINNLMVLAGVYLFAASGMKTWAGTRFRHPQLTGFSLWAAGHLLVNGNLPAIILFGTLLAWALVEIWLIDRQAPGWTPATTPVQPRREAMAAVAALVVYLILGLIHGWLGPNPFGG